MKLKQLKLNQLSANELKEREMNKLLGGERCCICLCQGTSPTYWNSVYNHDGGSTGLFSPGGGFGTGSFG